MIQQTIFLHHMSYFLFPKLNYYFFQSSKQQYKNQIENKN
jgi:hypothetical protein